MIKNSIKKILKNLKKISIKKNLKKILIENEQPNIILIGSPLHGNIGDHAISIAERNLLEKLDNKNIIEIPGEYYNLCTKTIVEFVKPTDIVLITGGGFIGSLWMNEENMVTSILSNFKNNKTIILPQTFFFENNDIGLSELKKFQNIVTEHKNLYIFTREKKSYDFCKENFNAAKDIILIPDMVLSLNFSSSTEDRHDILVCLRKDKEKSIGEQDKTNIFNHINKINENIIETTTVINQRISFSNRTEVLKNKLTEFKRSKLVITDRLHAMIFAAITSTPCIAFDNLSGKVKGVYQWLKDLNYIKFLDTPEQAIEIIDSLLKIRISNYNLDEQYNELFRKILTIIDN